MCVCVLFLLCSVLLVRKLDVDDVKISVLLKFALQNVTLLLCYVTVTELSL